MAIEIKKDILFKKVGDISLSGDLYQPAGKNGALENAKTPFVVVVHGGGWRSRSGDMTGICKVLARAGYAAFNITYRLAPEHLYPAAIEDVRAATKWIYENAGLYNLDPDKMFMWGYSAGAHLSLMIGLDPEYRVKGIVAGGTPSYFEFWPKSPIIKNFIGKSYTEAKDAWTEASPVNHVRENSPPVFMYHGTWDILVSHKQMTFMEEALKKKNVHVETYSAPKLGHVATYLLSREAIRRSLKFLGKALT